MNPKANTLSTASSAGAQLDEAAEEFFVLLGRAKAAMLKLYECPPAAMEELFASKALGPRHVPVMVRLACEGSMSVGKLAERLGVTLPTASLLVSELSRHGLVERREDEDDRRRTIVAVAEPYRDEMVAAYTERSAPVRRALDRLSFSERAALFKGLSAIGEEYERAVADTEARASVSDLAAASGPS